MVGRGNQKGMWFTLRKQVLIHDYEAAIMARNITFVKKILADGSLCRKCADIQKKLEENDQLQYIDQTLIADERDAASPGMQLANDLKVERAPFFVVRDGDDTKVYTVYLKFVKEVLDQSASQVDIDQETLKNSSDFDFL